MCVGTIVIAFASLFFFLDLIDVFHGRERPSAGAILFTLAYGTAGFFIRKAAVWELKRQKSLAADDLGASGEA
jgi:hypothetical protein